jgi:hypothetical protein
MPQETRKEETKQFRDFGRGMNQTAARTALRDDEVWWLENVQPIGPGQLQILPPPAATLATIAAGIATLWGFTIKLAGVETARLISVNNDGSMSAINPTTGAVTTIASAGTVTTQARLVMWQDTPLLIADPTKGYFSWDGTTLLSYPVALTGSTHTNTIIDGIAPNTTGLAVGMAITAADLPAGTTIASIDSATQIHISAAATGSNAGESITVGKAAPTTDFDVATFEGRTFLVSATRSLTMTAPASFTDFTTVDGATTVPISDSVFAGNIVRILSALEVLWIIGPAAVNALSNVQFAAGVTTFSNTNIVANVGTLFPSSVTSFFRTFLFLAQYGVYAIVGATPQKLSEQLDGLFPRLTFGVDQPAGIVSINNVFVWAVLVTYTDPLTNVPRPVLLCFSRNAWFIGSQGSLTWIASLVNLSTGAPELWGTDGTHIFKCFAGTVAGAYKVMTKLYDFGRFWEQKQLLRLAVEVQNIGASFQLNAAAVNELGISTTIPLVPTTTVLQFTGLAGANLNFTGAGGLAIVWIIPSQDVWGSASLKGDYIGINLTGTSLPFVISGLAMNYKWWGEWT